MTRSTFIAWGFLVLAIGAWIGFAYAVQFLSSERMAYVDAFLISEQESTRDESATRLRTTIQSTESERARLESLVDVTILRAVEVIETAGRDAGVSITIGGATPASNPSKGLVAYSISLSAQGSFVALMRTVALFEALPIPATIDQFEIGKGEKAWTLNGRMLVIVAAPK